MEDVSDAVRGEHDGGLNNGTMDGVHTLAGYADISSHGRVLSSISAPGEDSEIRYRLLGASCSSCSRRSRLIKRLHAGVR